MASTHFYYNPTAGTGNAQITVSAATDNQTLTAKTSTITFTNGVSSCTVDLIHKFRPQFTQGPTSIAATGGSVSGFCKSQYDIVFQNVPSWITITLNSSTIVENQRIGASALTAMPTTFLFTATPNTGDGRSASTTNFKFAYYMGDTLMSGDSTSIQIVQAPAEGIVTDVNELVFDWNETQAKTFNVVTFESWTSSIADD